MENVSPLAHLSLEIEGLNSSVNKKVLQRITGRDTVIEDLPAEYPEKAKRFPKSSH